MASEVPPDADPASSSTAHQPGRPVTPQLLVRNVIWNLLGQGAPLAIAFLAIPILVHTLGLERFGILAIAWVVVGYFSLLDLGLGRALTQMVARHVGVPNGMDAEELPALIRTGLGLMILLGLIGGCGLILISPWLVHTIMRVPSGLQGEALGTFYLLSASVPIVLASAGLRGVLEALQRFDLSNAVRVSLGIGTFLGPVLLLPLSHSLIPAVAILVLMRLAATGAFLGFCVHAIPQLNHRFDVNLGTLLPLMRFGGWMTVSNVVSPLLVYLDRLLVGATLSLSAVAYYATPYEAVTRLWVIAGALTGVLFPAFSTTLVSNSTRTLMLFERGCKYLLFTLFPLVLVIIAFAPEGLRFWLGSDFALRSTAVLRWLALGVLLNGLAQVPFALVQGAGRPDLTAKLHLLELPAYVLVLLLLLGTVGITGAAVAWTLRSALDMIVLFYMANRILRIDRWRQNRMAAVLAAAVAALSIPVAVTPLILRVIAVFVTITAFTVIVLLKGLSKEERRQLNPATMTKFWAGE